MKNTSQKELIITVKRDLQLLLKPGLSNMKTKSGFAQSAIYCPFTQAGVGGGATPAVLGKRKDLPDHKFTISFLIAQRKKYIN